MLPLLREDPLGLDYKGLAYETRNLIPGSHRRTVGRLAAQSHVPILLDGGLVDEAKVIQGSDAIIDHLDRRWPERRLTPLDRLSASLAAEWERYLDWVAEIYRTSRAPSHAGA